MIDCGRELGCARSLLRILYINSVGLIDSNVCRTFCTLYGDGKSSAFCTNFRKSDVLYDVTPHQRSVITRRARPNTYRSSPTAIGR